LGGITTRRAWAWVGVVCLCALAGCTPPRSKREPGQGELASHAATRSEPTRPHAETPAAASEPEAAARDPRIRRARVPAPPFVLELGEELVDALEANEMTELRATRLPYSTFEQVRWREALANAKGAERIPAEVSWRMMDADSQETEAWLLETYGGQRLTLVEADVEDVDVRTGDVELWVRPRYVVTLPDGSREELRVAGEIVRDTTTGEAWILRFDTWR